RDPAGWVRSGQLQDHHARQRAPDHGRTDDGRTDDGDDPLLRLPPVHVRGPVQAGSTASMAETSSGDSGSTRGRKRPTTSPSGDTRNFSKFHWMSPALPPASVPAVRWS